VRQTSTKLVLAAGLGLLAAAPILGAPAAQATPILLAVGTLGGTADLSGLTGTLENGLPANILGGLGSGLAYAGGNTFLAVPDRGPNATAYNPAVDDTSSFISRFHTVTLGLTPSGSGSLPFTLTPVLQSTTLLSSPTPLAYGTGAGLGNSIGGTPIGSGAPSQNTAGKSYFTGRSDNFDPAQTSGNPNNARLDPESIRVSNDGKSVFVSDEYGPYVYQFDRATGERIKSFALPANLDVSKLSPNGATEISGNTSGRVANKGMEGLAITPDGKTLVGIMQASLIQDTLGTNANPNLLRIVTIDIATGTTHEYGYLLHAGTGVSEIVAINDHQFLIDERDGKGLGDGSKAKSKLLYSIDLTGAQDITNLTGNAAAALAVPSNKVANLVDILTDPGLGANALTTSQIPSKIEGLAFGEDVTYGGTGYHTLYVANDNDFVPGVAGPSQFYVFGVTDADLFGTLVAQQLSPVPEPAAFGLLAVGLLGLVMVRRRTA
jgi:hypothetical protein